MMKGGFAKPHPFIVPSLIDTEAKIPEMIDQAFINAVTRSGFRRA